MPACVCVIRIAIFLHICGLVYNTKDFKRIDVALEQEPVCRMHLIVHLLALTSERVLPAVSNESAMNVGRVGGFLRGLMMLALISRLLWVENVLDFPISKPRSC